MDLYEHDYEATVHAVRDQYGFDFVSLAFVQSAADDFVLTWQFAAGNLTNRYKKVILRSGKGIAGIVFKTGKPVLVTKLSKEMEQNLLLNYPIVAYERLRSLGALPLYKGDHVCGVLMAGYRTENTMTKEKFEHFHQSFAGQFGAFTIKEMEL